MYRVSGKTGYTIPCILHPVIAYPLHAGRPHNLINQQRFNFAPPPMKPFLLWILTLLGIGRVSAQSDSGLPRLLPTGNNPEAIIRQEIQDFVPLNMPNNHTEVRQNGNFNMANIATSGNLLTVMVSQSGNLNRMNLDVHGEDSRLTLSQKGDYNQMSLLKLTVGGSDFQATQHDNFNSLEIDGAKSGILPSITIEQRGGMHLIIDSPSGYHIR